MPLSNSQMKADPPDRVPTMLKVAFGLLLGFAGGILLGRFNR